jgi:hypothetical protein
MLIAMCLTILSIVIYGSKYFLKKKKELPAEELSKKYVNTLKFLIAIILYFALWVLSVSFLWLSAIYIAPLIIISTYLLYKVLMVFLIQKTDIKKNNIKEAIKSQFDRDTILYSVFAGCTFMGFYYLIAFTVPWTLLYPPDFASFIGSFLIFPLYLSSEIVYRKVLYPVTTFIESPKKRTLFVSIIILFFHMYFVFNSFWYYGYPDLIAAFFAFLMATMINSILYHKTKKFSSVLINSIIINGLFFGAAIPALIGFMQIL